MEHDADSKRNTINDLTQGTIEAWVNLNALDDQTICAKQSDLENTYALHNVGIGSTVSSPVPTGHVMYQSTNSAAIISNTALTAGQSHHIAVSFNGTGASLYIDGVLDQTASGNFILPNDVTITAAAIGAWIGSFNPPYSLNDSLEEFRVWNTIRTADQIANSRFCELSGSETGLVLYYQLNQGANGTYNPTVTTVTDMSASAINGTLTNAELNGTVSNWRATSPVTTGSVVPAAPTAANVTYCLNETASQLTAADTGLVWYTVATGGRSVTTAPTPSTASAGTTSFWAASTNANSCEGDRTQIDVTITAPSYGTDLQIICESYTWIDGNTYTASNNTAMYTISGGAANGCDSIVTLDLTITQPTIGTDLQTACESYTWIDGNTYTASNSTATYIVSGGAANGCDSIVTLDLTITQPTNGTDIQNACETFTWIDGNTYTASNNTATYVISGGAANGCDSIVTLDLTINSSPVASASNSNSTLTAMPSGMTYQWINCNGNVPVANANSVSFTPATAGDYAVVVTNSSGCSDTSACVQSSVGLDELEAINLTLFPNPTADFVTVSFQKSGTAFIKLMDATGATLGVYQLKSEQSIKVNELPNGVYFLEIEIDGNFGVRRLIKM